MDSELYDYELMIIVILRVKDKNEEFSNIFSASHI